MRVLIILSCLLLLAVAANAQIVHNATSDLTSQDSLSFQFDYRDSLGQPVAASTNDWFKVFIASPSGIMDTLDVPYNDSRVTSMSGTNVGSKYTFRAPVADLDVGASLGVYVVSIVAYDSTLDLATPSNSYQFQLIDTLFSEKLMALPNRADFDTVPDNWPLVLSENGCVTPTDTTEGGGSIGTSTWNSTQRDSILSAVTDYKIGQKAWAWGTRSLTDKSGFSLTQSFPSNFSSLSINGSGYVTVVTNNDKTGYALTQAFPTNFSSMGITATGQVGINWGNVLNQDASVNLSNSQIYYVSSLPKVGVASINANVITDTTVTAAFLSDVKSGLATTAALALAADSVDAIAVRSDSLLYMLTKVAIVSGSVPGAKKLYAKNENDKTDTIYFLFDVDTTLAMKIYSPSDSSSAIDSTKMFEP